MLYPPFAFCRLIYRLSIKCSNFVCARGFADFDYEMFQCLAVLYVGSVVYLALGIYLDLVMPQEYGVRKKPFYFLKNCLRRNKQPAQDKNNIYAEIADKVLMDKFENAIDMSGEDDDVKREADFVNGLQGPLHEYPLVIKNLRKVYKPVGGRPSKIAVEDISLCVKRGEMFGLLGPNGAGKTSLISMLTGLYKPENGNAWIGGYDIINQIELVHTCMGVCPQFDLLWPELTVEEHLLFYARIRGVSKKKEKYVVKKAIEEVRLTQFATFQTRQLSGMTLNSKRVLMVYRWNEKKTLSGARFCG